MPLVSNFEIECCYSIIYFFILSLKDGNLPKYFSYYSSSIIGLIPKSIKSKIKKEIDDASALQSTIYNQPGFRRSQQVRVLLISNDFNNGRSSYWFDEYRQFQLKSDGGFQPLGIRLASPPLQPISGTN